MSDNAVQLVKTRSWVAVPSSLFSFHFLITVWVVHVTEKPFSCPIWIVVLRNEIKLNTQLLRALVTFFSEKPVIAIKLSTNSFETCPLPPLPYFFTFKGSSNSILLNKIIYLDCPYFQSTRLRPYRNCYYQNCREHA